MKDSSCNIPKIIHYVWLGVGRKDTTVNKCIQSWKKFCPDYQIIEWNDASIQKIENTFLKEAVQEKKWAFASDYVRLYALYNFGGLYFDTDLELTAPLDSFLHHDFFCGFEDSLGHPSTALLGSKKGDSVISEFLDYYKLRHFVVNGVQDRTPNPQIFRKILSDRDPAFNNANGEIFQLDQSRLIYPIGYFLKNQNDGNNYAIHHFEGSWQNEVHSRTILKIGRFEIRKVKSEPSAPFPPKFENSTRVLGYIRYNSNPRGRIYFLLCR